ncbi:ABC transporter permease [Cellulosilyticum ruminicola]|uniref:ABC transporter permease n=1 Tax=Cellulosilyticum ruminicola TaxID=425254 RepID=UPI0006D2BAE7|nr:ABC transporter permease [Cellulosilyticum ruminicola]
MMTPYKFTANEFNARGKYNYIAANKSEEKVSGSVDLFNDTNNKFKAYELYSESTVMMAISMIAGILYMMFAIIVGMSMIIIYSSFKLIITERLKVIGTFLSQGSTKKTIKRILKLEGIGYGILGGILGDIIGCIIIYIGNYEMSPMHKYGIVEELNIPPEYLIAGFIFALILPVISASIPIRKINELEVKELILNTPSMVEGGGWLKFIIGVLFVGIAILYTLFGNIQVLVMAPVVLLLSIIGVINIAPKCIAFISNKIFKYTKGTFPVVSIALNNVGTSKVLLGNINLMLIAMLTVVLINSTSISMEKAIRAGYSDLNYDLKITVTRNEDLIMGILRGEKSIDKKTVQKMYTANTELNGLDFYTLGIDEDKYTSYDKYFNWEQEEYGTAYENFKSGPYNSTIISQKVADTLKLKVGDKIEVEVNEKTQPLIVEGIIEGKLYYNSLFIMVKNVVFTDRFRVKFADTIVCNTSKDPAEVKNKISEDLHKCGGSVSTYPETIEINVQQIGQLISILNIFSYIAIIISSLGVINNISISFIQRKKSIVVLSSVGMAYNQFKKMLIVESLFTIIWPAVIITLYSTMGMKLVSGTTKLMGLALDIKFNMSILPSLLVVSSIIVVVATIPALFMNKKMKIVDELKYE